jgi:hypothetical protein
MLTSGKERWFLITQEREYELEVKPNETTVDQAHSFLGKELLR